MNSNKKARFESSDIWYKEHENYCVEFYYYLHGLYPATLNVYLKQNNSLGSPVWTKFNTPQKGWVRGEFKINRVQYETFQVSFEAANPQYVSSVSRTELKFNFIRCLNKFSLQSVNSS